MGHRHFSIQSRFEVGREVWDSFVELSDEAWLWHRFDLQDALATWPGRFDLSFAVLDESQGGQMVALMPLHLLIRHKFWFFPYRTLESLGGPACRNNIKKKTKRHLFNWLYQELKNLAKHHHAMEINLSLAPMAPAFRGERCPLVNPLLQLGCENTLRQTWVIDLRSGTEQVWVNMESRARNMVRKALHHGVQVRLADRPEDFDIYYGLHCETYQRTGVRPHPKSYFEAIWKNFVRQGLAVVFLAEWQNMPVAAANFGVFKKAAVYWTGGASGQGLSLAANSLLQWLAMRWMVDQGLDWYETGEAFPHLQSGKLKGLDDFKKSFGGELYPYYCGRILRNEIIYNLMQLLKTRRRV